MLFEPGGGAKRLFVAASRQCAVAFGVELFDVEQYQVGQAQQLFYFLVPDAAVGVQAGMDFPGPGRLKKFGNSVYH